MTPPWNLPQYDPDPFWYMIRDTDLARLSNVVRVEIQPGNPGTPDPHTRDTTLRWTQVGIAAQTEETMTDTQTTETTEYAWPEDLSVENSGGDFILAEEDFYGYIRLDDVGPVQPVVEKYNPHGDKFQALFYFSIYNDERYEDGKAKIQQYFTLSLNEKANLYPIVKALMGGTLDPKYKLQPKDVVGKFFRGKVFHTEPNSKDQVYAKIEPSSAMPIKGAAPEVAPF